jgi:hypothetical protein
MTPSKRLKPFMAYIEDAQHNALTKYSKKAKIPMSQLVREAIALRIAPDNPYRAGFNDGLQKAIFVVNANEASKMRFPSGRSFAELINQDIESAMMGEHHEA